jgi:DNA-binding transcriptional LysR family regulator
VAAASKRISDLEKHLGVSLLYRHASGVKLTEAGRVCFQHALDVLEGVERLSNAMSDYAAGVRGQIRIWANTSAITQFLPDDLSAFMRAHPGIRTWKNATASRWWRPCARTAPISASSPNAPRPKAWQCLNTAATS